VGASSIPKRFFLVFATLVLGLLILPCPAEAAVYQDHFPQEDWELAVRFAPVLYFHPDELFRPQSVNVLVDTARLRQIQNTWLVTNVLNEVSLADLSEYRSADYTLDAWLGDEGTSDSKNYSAHREHYQHFLSHEAGGPPIVTYAHVVRQPEDQRIVLQYWLFYYYNDWFNKHEGDWEMVQVILSESANPEWVVLSQHHGGTRRLWSEVQVEEGTHPAVFVALGSHANYFCGDENYPNGTTVGNAQVEIMDRTGSFGRIMPEVRLIPDREEVNLNPGKWPGLEWLLFAGHWGQAAPQGDFSGPVGPADKGDLWERPYQWGMNQPLDVETWYRNRLRVQLKGQGITESQVILRAEDGTMLPTVESLGNTALLHVDPAPGEVIVADLQVASSSPYDVWAAWPDAEASEVTRYHFGGVPPGNSSRVLLTLTADKLPTLVVDGLANSQELTAIESEPAAWDAPDLVWAAGLLPASDVLRGLIIILLATYIPTLLYVTALYHCDRYEKEPKQLLLFAFLWGAWPAVLVAVCVRIFFQLPVDALGPDVIEATQAGILSPLIEETIKGAAVIFIALRFRREFDGILDGIIYGAVVGLGFAMTANMIGYFGSFLLYGFAVLRTSILFEGVLYGLNQGFYTAIFAVGLGYARLTTKRRQRWLVPLAAFGLAVAVHALHNIAIRNAEGFNLFTVTLNWIGVLVMVALITWSVRLEKNTMETELVGEIPDELYFRLITMGGRRRAQLRALKEKGLHGLRDVRRVHKLCAELAFKKKQYRLRPEELDMREEATQLREELQAMLARG
jgi:RsiW-degrading membrane proteinase PrsW (M82 family)